MAKTDGTVSGEKAMEKEMAAALRWRSASLAGMLVAMVCTCISLSIDYLDAIQSAPGDQAITPSGALLLAVSGVAGVLIAILLVKLLVDSRTNCALYSKLQVKLLLWLGILFGACVVLRAAFSVAVSLGAFCEPGPNSWPIGIFSDVRGDILLIAIMLVCFYLSYSFKYAYFLQWFYDETV